MVQRFSGQEYWILDRFLREIHRSLYCPKKKLVVVVALSGTIQGNKEMLWTYIDQFTQVDVELLGAKKPLSAGYPRTAFVG